MPKDYPAALAREVNGRLQETCMFGSDDPALYPEDWIDEFEERYKPEGIEKVFYKNALEILNLNVKSGISKGREKHSGIHKITGFI